MRKIVLLALALCWLVPAAALARVSEAIPMKIDGIQIFTGDEKIPAHTGVCLLEGVGSSVAEALGDIVAEAKKQGADAVVILHVQSDHGRWVMVRAIKLKV
jgi:hypothetical protein